MILRRSSSIWRILPLAIVIIHHWYRLPIRCPIPSLPAIPGRRPTNRASSGSQIAATLQSALSSPRRDTSRLSFLARERRISLRRSSVRALALSRSLASFSATSPVGGVSPRDKPGGGPSTILCNSLQGAQKSRPFAIASAQVSRGKLPHAPLVSSPPILALLSCDSDTLPADRPPAGHHQETDHNA